jgi:hypothetical protein
MRQLAFLGTGITLGRYTAAELRQGKTSDFKLYKDGQLVGFCELKSPIDDYVFDSPPPGQPAVRRNIPYYRKLGSHVRYAAKQFDAVNKDRELPNILAFVSHAPDIERRDLRLTITGIAVPGAQRMFMLSKRMQHQVIAAARRIDLFLWIDATKGTLEHPSPADGLHQTRALELVGRENEAPAATGIGGA